MVTLVVLKRPKVLRNAAQAKVSKKTPVTWKGVGKRKKAVVAEKRRVGMGKRTSSIRKRRKK